MADSSDSVVSNNANNCKDLSVVQSSDKIDENKTDKGKSFLSKNICNLRKDHFHSNDSCVLLCFSLHK